MTSKTSRPNLKSRTDTVQPPSLSHRLDALLHAMRSIAQYEDALCELSHEAKKNGTLSEVSSAELNAILEKIPAQEYEIDLEAVKALQVQPHSPAAKQTTKKTAGRKPSK